MTDEEKYFFREELDFTSMNDDIMEFWQSQFDRDIVLAEQAAERERLAEEEEIEKIRNKEQKKADRACARAIKRREVALKKLAEAKKKNTT